MSSPEEPTLVEGGTTSWALVTKTIAGFGVLFGVLVGSLASSLELTLLAVELAVMGAAVLLSGVIGRSAALHVISGSFIVYQTVVLDITRHTPNLGVVWFLLVPSWTILWGRTRHVVVWGPVTALAIGYTAYRADPSDPVWQHPLTLPNLLAVLGFSVLLVIGFQRERRRREHQLEAFNRRVVDEAEVRRGAEAKMRSAEFARHRLLAMLSHELRSPMTSLALSADLIADDEAPDPQRSAKLRQCAHATLRTLDDILDLVRLEEGVVPRRSEAFSLFDLLEDVADLVLPQLEAGDVELVVDVGPRLRDRWLGDRARLRQVLLNLIGNALKHAPGGRIRVLVEGETSSRLCFCVQDTGVGIASEVVEHVFEPWHQGESNEPPGGVGLGLSISRDFVEAMGGRIWVDTSVQVGSRICFDVGVEPVETSVPTTVAPRSRSPLRCVGFDAWTGPRVRAWARAWGVPLEDDARGVLDARSSLGMHASLRRLVEAFDRAAGLEVGTRTQGADPGPSLAGRSVLVVDDDEVVRGVIAAVLERAGASVESARDGSEAEAAVRTRRFDVVVLDLEMPGRTGLDVLAALTADPEVALPGVIVLSGSLDAEAAALRAGAQAFVSKPIRARPLLRVVDEIARRGRGRDVG